MSTMQRSAWLTLACALVFACDVFAWELPIQVKEEWSQGGLRYVTGGVPLLPGQAKEPTELRLALKDKDGKLTAVPAQFRVLARWWRADNSIRWVLVDLQANMAGADTKTFVLTNDKIDDAAPKAPCQVEETADEITITTGPARFVVSKKKFNFLNHAYVDDNADGKFDETEDMLAATPDHGTVLEDTFGEKYYSSEQAKSVDIIDKGPMRVQIRAQGVHRARGGKGYSKGMYQYDCFMNFFAGSTDVSVDLVLSNTPAQSIGTPTFEDASLVLKLAGGGPDFRLYGCAPLDGSLAAGESVCLYQDSNGSESWQRNTGGGGKPTFRGYKILKRSGGKEAELTDGDQARGLAHLSNDRGGVIIYMKNFWQQFPKAVEVAADGTVRLGMFPREYALPHYLEDASAKGHEIIIHFYTKKLAKVYAADEAGRTWPHVVADCWDYPVFPKPSLEHICATGALTDVGPQSVPITGFDGYALEVNERRLLMTDKYKGNGLGWQVYGERWDSYGGHSSRGARQPIKEDNFLYRWYITGHREWLVVGNNRSRNFRDVRAYRIEDQDPFGFKSWEDFNSHNVSEDYCNRPQPNGAEIQKYSAGKWARADWRLTNPAHMTLDLIYDRYLLFGDVRSLENMKVVAGHGALVAYAKPYVHRDTGWSWRAPERYWELTGDKGAEKLIQTMLENYKVMIGKTPLVCPEAAGKVNWWFTQVFSRAVAMTALHMGDQRAIDLAKTLAVGDVEKQRAYFCTLFSVLYHLTGDEKYKQIVLGKDETGQKLLVAAEHGDFSATAHYLLFQPTLKK